jgi:dUTPase
MAEFDFNEVRTVLNLNTTHLLDTYGKIMYLKIFVDEENCEPGLKEKYIVHAIYHNTKILDSDNNYPDAGFDILNPVRKEINYNNQQLATSFSSNNMNTINKINFSIVCSAHIITNSKAFNTGYYMYPRSSLSKSKLRLANSVGIIDSGYRGNLIGMFDLINMKANETYVIDKYDRLVQICAPGLFPIVVEIVNTFEELGKETERGTGGFGSTGV